MNNSDEVKPWATVSELERWTKTTRQNIYKHIRRADIRPDAKHRYPTEDVLRAMYRHREDDLRHAPPGTEKARKLRLQCDLLELRKLQLERRLVSVEGLVSAWADMTSTTAARILSVPAQAAPECAGQDAATIQATFERHLTEALEELVNYDPNPQGNRQDSS